MIFPFNPPLVILIKWLYMLKLLTLNFINEVFKQYRIDVRAEK
jgi:hypothetical protein